MVHTRTRTYAHPCHRSRHEGITLAFPVWNATAFDGATTSYSISLDEAAGWI